MFKRRRGSSKGVPRKQSRVARALRRARAQSRRYKNRYFYAPHTKQPIGPALVKFLRAKSARKPAASVVVPVGHRSHFAHGGHPAYVVAPPSKIGSALRSMGVIA